MERLVSSMWGAHVGHQFLLEKMEEVHLVAVVIWFLKSGGVQPHMLMTTAGPGPCHHPPPSPAPE